MKRFMGFLAIFVSLSVVAHCQSPADPFADLDSPSKPAPPADPFADPDPNAPFGPINRLTLLYEVIQIAKDDWLAWTSDSENSIRGSELRSHVQQLLEEDAESAKIIEMAAMPVLSGQRAKTLSTDLLIYPTEYEPSSLPEPWDFVITAPYFAAAWESRNVGLSWEVDPVIGADGRTIDVNLNPELVAVGEIREFDRGFGPHKIPIFSTRRVTTSTTTWPKSPSLVGAFPPLAPLNQEGDEAVWLAFVTAEMHELQLPVDPPEPKPRLIRNRVPHLATFLFEWIETEQTILQQLRGLESSQMRKAVQVLVDSGKADIVESLSLPAKLGQHAKAEAIEEFIYCTEYDPPEYREADGKLLAPPIAAAFETRNIGHVAELSAMMRPDLTGLEVELNPECIQLLGMTEWGHEGLEVEMPDIAMARTTATVFFPFGVNQLISTHHSPKAFDPKRKNPRLLLFARVEGSDFEEQEADLKAAVNPQLQMLVEIFETTQTDLNALRQNKDISLAGQQLRNELAKADTPIETIFFSSVSGKRCKIESIDREFIAPSEYDPPEHIEATDEFTPCNPAAWETWDLGVRLDLDATASSHGYITVKFDGDEVSLSRMNEHFEGPAKAVMPEFRTQRITTSLFFADGVPALLGTTKPAAEDDRIRVWFMTATRAE